LSPGGYHGGRGGRGHGQGRGFRGGRPPVIPEVQKEIHYIGGEYTLELTRVELEALRLIDQENLTQEKAAEIMKISRGTLWRIIQDARQKVIQALVSGNTRIKLVPKKEE
jgi:predicted DNA-binding protein (UPF0251 family)